MKSASDPRASGKTGKSGGPLPGPETELGALLSILELRHPHLVAMQPIPGQVGFEPDLAGGELLSQLCRNKYASRPIPLRFGLRILLDTLSGLAALHAAKKNGRPLGFAHGELAPCNVVIGRDGLGRLIPLVNAHWDRGAAANPETTGYAAPEKLRGDPFDQRADTFSAGVMLWEMITGRSFRGLPAEIITAWVVDGKVPDPLQPDDAPWVVALGTVATTALAVDPAQRWSHVGLMGAEIEAIVEDHMASSSEVARLLSDDRAAPLQEPAHAPSPTAPSISPTSMSIPPAPPSVRPSPAALGDARPRDTLSYEQGPSAAASFQLPPLPDLSATSSQPSGKKRHRQSLIAWSTMGVALALLAIAAHELFSSPPSRPAASAPARPSLRPTVPPPVALPVESPDPPSSVGIASPPDPDPPRAPAPPPSAGSLPSAPMGSPAAQSSAKAGPHHKAPPPSPPVRKGSKRDDQFGI